MSKKLSSSFNMNHGGYDIVALGVLIIKKNIYLIKINPDGIHASHCVNKENLLEAIYRHGSH